MSREEFEELVEDYGFERAEITAGRRREKPTKELQLIMNEYDRLRAEVKIQTERADTAEKALEALNRVIEKKRITPLQKENEELREIIKNGDGKYNGVARFIKESAKYAAEVERLELDREKQRLVYNSLIDSTHNERKELEKFKNENAELEAEVERLEKMVSPVNAHLLERVDELKAEVERYKATENMRYPYDDLGALSEGRRDVDVDVDMLLHRYAYKHVEVIERGDPTGEDTAEELRLRNEIITEAREAVLKPFSAVWWQAVLISGYKRYGWVKAMDMIPYIEERRVIATRREAGIYIEELVKKEFWGK